MAYDRFYRPGQMRLKEKDALYIAPLCVLAVMLVISMFTGLWPWKTNFYNSYALQSDAWLHGRLDLGKDYEWLELAIFEGKYYVSFPPFPSYVLLPFSLFFGQATPDSLICWVFSLIGVCSAVKMCLSLGTGPKLALFWTLYLYMGSGWLFLGQTGYVWFMAQSMAFALSLLSLQCALENKGGFSLGFWACAVGCRPLVAIYLPLLFYLLRQHEKEKRIPTWIRSHLTWAIAPCLIAFSYMLLNYLRFGNPMEFGHNYLPEFVRAPLGQFSLSYVPEHLRLLLRLPTIDAKSGALVFEKIETSAFYLICPLTVSFFLSLIQGIRSRRGGGLLVLVPVLLCLHVLFTCMHGTLGGFQFGNRYFVDLMPYLLLGLLSFRSPSERFDFTQLPLLLFGFAVNFMGTIVTYNNW